MANAPINCTSCVSSPGRKLMMPDTTPPTSPSRRLRISPEWNSRSASQRDSMIRSKTSCRTSFITRTRTCAVIHEAMARKASCPTVLHLGSHRVDQVLGCDRSQKSHDNGDQPDDHKRRHTHPVFSYVVGQPHPLPQVLTYLPLIFLQLTHSVSHILPRGRTGSADIWHYYTTRAAGNQGFSLPCPPCFL